MRLKQVVLTNFKSYRDETRVSIEDKTTIIVGENGAGKTNFLQAVDFILGSRHANLNRISRPRFINNAGDKKEASIEIFLQDDGKVFGEEVLIRRQFNFCSEKLYFNGSRIRKLHLSFVFEVLGLPRPTLYYTISSAQLKELVSSNPNARLNALINYLGLCIARTVSFLKNLLPGMEDWDEKVKQIDQLLKNHKPEDIQAEVVRHQKYAALKKMKSTIGFQISSLRIESWKATIADEANTLLMKGTTAQTLYSLKCSITSTKLTLQQSISDAVSAKVLLDGLIQTKESLVKNVESLNLSINDMNDQVGAEELNISVGTIEVAGNVQERIMEVENELKVEQAAVEEICKKLREEEQKRDDLILILSCKDKFSTLPEKKLWIQDEIGKLKKAHDKNVEDAKIYEFRKSRINQSIVDCEKRIKQLDNEDNVHQDLRKELTSVKHRLGEMQIEFQYVGHILSAFSQQQLNSHENVIINEIGVLMNSLKSKKTELSCKVGHSTLNGVLSVESVRGTWRSTDDSFASGCYGTVLDNINCDAALNLALDAAVGSRLLAQIVETDTIGTAVLREMKSRDFPGEVVFLPLNRILSQEAPNIRVDGVELMMNQLSFPATIRGAISHLFGRILLCRDLELATKVAREFHCVCVTIQGDRVVGNGAITGGYVDRNAAIRTLYLAYKTLETNHKDKIVILQNQRDDICALKSNIDSLVSFTQRAEIRTMDGNNAAARKMLMAQLETMKKDECHWAMQIKLKEKDNAILVKKKEALEKSFYENLSDVDAHHQLQAFNRKAFELEKTFNQHNANLNLLKSEISLLRNKVKCSVQKDEMKIASSSKCKAIHLKIKDYKTKQDLLSSHLRAVDDDIVQASTKLNAANQKVEELKSVLDNLKQKLLQANLNAAGLDTSGPRDLIKEYEEKIKKEEELMALEAKNTDKKLLAELSGLSLKQLQNRLADTTRDLDIVAKTLEMSPRVLKSAKKFIEIWRTYNGYKDFHMSLRAMAEKFHSWVQQHVSLSLEQVCNLFTRYFNMMAANGNGSMHIERSEAEPALAITGIVISVLFTGDLNVSLPSTLSTGQQVVVFLATILALMNSQRSCFCVLDEIDQSLTNDRIEGLLNAISDVHRQGHQFLISSHNIRMIRGGQQHFLVNCKREKSRIRSVTSTEAVHFAEMISDVYKPFRTSTTSTSSQSTFASHAESQSSQQSTASDLWRPY